MGLFKGKIKEIGEGIKEAFTGAGDGISQVINSAKGQIPPEMQGQVSIIEETAKGELKKLQIEMEVKLAELAAEGQKEIYNFALQYEGSASQVPKWILVLRSIIRPVITICMFFSLMFFIGFDAFQLFKGNTGNLIMPLLPQAYWVIQGIVLGFWFGGKAGENIVDKIKKT